MTSNPLPTVQVQVDIPKKEIHKRLFSKRLEELDEGKTGMLGGQAILVKSTQLHTTITVAMLPPSVIFPIFSTTHQSGTKTLDTKVSRVTDEVVILIEIEIRGGII